MDHDQSLCHTKYDCKYHVVWCRRQVEMSGSVAHELSAFCQGRQAAGAERRPPASPCAVKRIHAAFFGAANTSWHPWLSYRASFLGP